MNGPESAPLAALIEMWAGLARIFVPIIVAGSVALALFVLGSVGWLGVREMNKNKRSTARPLHHADPERRTAPFPAGARR